MARSAPRLSPELWARVTPILDEALELDSGARTAYVQRACAGDDGLRAAVERLLAADRDSGGFLEQPADAYLSDVLPDPDALPPGTLVGPYRVIRELGHGGMGLVYLAERADGQFEQQVALKLVRTGLLGEEVQRRFLSERRILARLDHPNIAHLVDGGLAANGRPWFAMEYVDGAPLVDWCDQRRLGVLERIRLFTDVCEAVRHAHQKLLVHRDIKPSNILVTGEGRVKLLDFGIAKLLDDTDEEQGTTRTGLRLLTPEYAAPEQVRGEAVTTATDVYALGAMLYELLVGRRVHQFARLTPAEIERVICLEEPTVPSFAVARDRDQAVRRGTDTGRLRRHLRGDLDTVILRALQKDPGRRYPTADALLADLRRYLDGLPVEARPDSTWYRTSRFVRRHWIGVSATVAVVLALAVGLAVAIWQARVAAHQAARATAVKEFLLGIFRTADPVEARGRDVRARELLDRGVTQVDSALLGQPELQEELLAALGQIHQSLGLYDQADSLLSRAVEAARQAHGERSAEYAARLNDHGAVLRLAGKLGSAESVLNMALAARTARFGPRHPEVATTITELALVADDRGDSPRANDLARKAMEIDRNHYGPADLHVARDLELMARLHGEIGGELPLADSAYRAALAILRRSHDAGHPDVLRVQNGLAANLRALRRFPEAETLQVATLRELQRLHPEGHPDVATSLTNLGILYSRQRRYVEAESAQVQALAMRERLLGPNSRGTLETLNDLAVLLASAQQPERAEAMLRTAAVRSEAALGPENPATRSAIGNLGVLLTTNGHYLEAESVLTRLLALQQALPVARSGVARTYVRLGHVRRYQERYDDAIASFRAAVVIAREDTAARMTPLIGALNGLGGVLYKTNRFREAEVVLAEGVALRRARADSADINRLWDERIYGVVLGRRGKMLAAESTLVAAYRASAANPQAGEVRTELGKALADLYTRWGKLESAKDFLPGPERRAPGSKP